MKLVSFSYLSIPCENRIGFLSDDGSHVADLTSEFQVEGKIITSMLEYLRLGSTGQCFAERCMANGRDIVPINSVALKAPITDPDKIICVGMNYREHCTEQGGFLSDCVPLFYGYNKGFQSQLSPSFFLSFRAQ
jgi:2-keto-4-pentenoate hydratase/2-oxohepta-3-ene-1,7-dioic acid hydratase in catechol pathway